MQWYNLDNFEEFCYTSHSLCGWRNVGRTSGKAAMGMVRKRVEIFSRFTSLVILAYTTQNIIYARGQYRK